ncbi:MAG TPA: peptide chain release factor N(5)-glutamine methyltransferase [Arachidicoccus sp.]
MSSIKEVSQDLVSALQSIYNRREAMLIGEMVMEKATNLSKIERLLRKDELLDLNSLRQITAYKIQLLQARPIQYVLGQAWFLQMPFFVQEGVLIPRPETEELVQWIIDSHSPSSQTIVDIGTGTGAIAIGLKKYFPDATIFGMDISKEALQIAEKNAENLGFDINFREMDILDQSNWQSFPKVDIIVSNPPYICERERVEMDANVLLFEPEAALFVPNDQPLLFYEAITNFALQKLNRNGWLYFEINEAFGGEMEKLLRDSNFQKVELKQDLQAKDRMVRAQLIGQR